MNASSPERRDTLLVTAVVISLLALFGTVVGIGLGARAIDEAKHGGGTQVSAGGAPTSVDVTEKEFSIDPKTVTIAAGGSLKVTNAGAVEHNLTVEGTSAATPNIAAGATATLDLSSLKAGTYKLLCTVPGHAQAGMTAELKIGEGGGGTAAAPTTPTTLSADQIDAATKKTITDFVAGAKTAGKGAQPMTPKVLADGTKEFDLTASEFDWEISPGKKVKAWGYNNVVPGPLIRVNTGDKVRVVLKNELPESTSIHWHGIVTPNSQDGVPDVTQPPVKSGETFTYDFVAQGPAVGLYHAHQDSQKQVPAGLLGPFIIDDLPLPAGVSITQRIPMVLNDAGNIGFSLNGKSFPATDPIVTKPGDWVEIDYMNEGLQIHPMHTHGFSQLIIARDGYPVPQPYREDTVLIAPGQRISVLVHTDSAGVWLLHCHILTHAESENGYFGMATAFVVK